MDIKSLQTRIREIDSKNTRLEELTVRPCENNCIKNCYYVRLSTSTMLYFITAVEHSCQEHGSYLGGSVSDLIPNVGESHVRGSDLSDGKLTEETWEHILWDIVHCELQPLPVKDATALSLYGILLNVLQSLEGFCRWYIDNVDGFCCWHTNNEGVFSRKGTFPGNYFRGTDGSDPDRLVVDIDEL